MIKLPETLYPYVRLFRRHVSRSHFRPKRSKATLIKFTAAIIFLTATFAAKADDLTIFGFELGKPLTLPECPIESLISEPGHKLYKTVVPVTCIQDAHPLDGYGQPVREITFSLKDCPLIVKNWRAFPLEEEGNLIGFHFLTTGIASQDVVMQQLQKKYGKPTSIKKNAVQNGFGATFETINAQWQTGKVTVTFHGTLDRLGTGEVFVDLPAAVKLRKSWEKSSHSSERKM